MNITLLFIIAAAILIFLIIYRSKVGEQTYQFVSSNARKLYSKVAPYTYKEIRKKIIKNEERETNSLFLLFFLVPFPM